MKISTRAIEDIQLSPELETAVNEVGRRLEDDVALFDVVKHDHPQLNDVMSDLQQSILDAETSVNSLKGEIIQQKLNDLTSDEEKACALLNGEVLVEPSPEDAIVDILNEPITLISVTGENNLNEEGATEDTVKQGNYWVNRGEEGTHGKFRTKKAADAQRRAMFASGYVAKEAEEGEPDIQLGTEEGEDYIVLIKESLDEGFLEYRFRDEYQAYGTFDEASRANKPAVLLGIENNDISLLAMSPTSVPMLEEVKEQISLLKI